MAGGAVGFQRSQGSRREAGHELAVNKVLHDGLPLADAAAAQQADVEIHVLGHVQLFAGVKRHVLLLALDGVGFRQASLREVVKPQDVGIPVQQGVVEVEKREFHEVLQSSHLPWAS